MHLCAGDGLHIQLFTKDDFDRISMQVSKGDVTVQSDWREAGAARAGPRFVDPEEEGQRADARIEKGILTRTRQGSFQIRAS